MIPRRPIPIIFIIGNNDNKITAEINVLIKNLIYMLKKLSVELSEGQLYFAVLSSSNGGEWITGKGLIVDYDFCLSEDESCQRRKEIEEYNAMPLLLRNGEKMKDDGVFIWHDIDFSHNVNLTDLFYILNEGLSRKKVLSSLFGGMLPPKLLLFYNGFPSSDCENALKQLQQNAWYQHSTKIAIVCNPDTDINILNEFTENTETVLNINDPELLQKTNRIINLGHIDE